MNYKLPGSYYHILVNVMQRLLRSPIMLGKLEGERRGGLPATM